MYKKGKKKKVYLLKEKKVNRHKKKKEKILKKKRVFPKEENEYRENILTVLKNQVKRERRKQKKS